MEEEKIPTMDELARQFVANALYAADDALTTKLAEAKGYELEILTQYLPLIETLVDAASKLN